MRKSPAKYFLIFFFITFKKLLINKLSTLHSYLSSEYTFSLALTRKFSVLDRPILYIGILNSKNTISRKCFQFYLLYIAFIRVGTLHLFCYCCFLILSFHLFHWIHLRKIEILFKIFLYEVVTSMKNFKWTRIKTLVTILYCPFHWTIVLETPYQDIVVHLEHNELVYHRLMIHQHIVMLAYFKDRMQ